MVATGLLVSDAVCRASSLAYDGAVGLSSGLWNLVFGAKGGVALTAHAGDAVLGLKDAVLAGGSWLLDALTWSLVKMGEAVMTGAAWLWSWLMGAAAWIQVQMGSGGASVVDGVVGLGQRWVPYSLYLAPPCN